ncbi:SDR family oxidoreductase [Prosthecochloris sp. N3]|uniref:SDR family oxidoreductase n=1 Tax=Prosthecochloris ethylica TaxID=2743976 RepID=A0ABR9XRS1_9CHLB|nr:MULTISPECIES: SDR family oxidoreductase [Prosthecochloris]MBF0586911.1 SDR family oxidoreductase [Prosthecochloris ethylica]MBF0636741.1 SDR family oxidoreductase [Prosthecochloris ethylica]NUK48417.1 SDR family oxidoreductase [Prosthecochloris ethylica]RNA64256.1 SDR family oxidoreductase [Prosthecochloris sp. ZM_2]
MQNTRISILGCGWLGLPLGSFLASQGYPVKGSTMSADRFSELRDAGIEPFMISLSPSLEGDDVDGFLQSDILVINIPPERRPDIEEYHQKQFASLMPALVSSPVSRVVFVSSTSVYPALERSVTEQDAIDPEASSGKALLAVERMLMGQSSFKTTVLRFCGLIGYDRDPSVMLRRLDSLANADQPVNLVHRDDCIGIIHEVIVQEAWGEVFNACSPGHPLRRDYYRRAAERAGLPLPPDAGDSPRSWKIIDSSKLERQLGYRFRVPDPLRLP